MKKLLIIALLGLFGTIFASAQKNATTAFVDLQYILKNLPQYETANEQLTLISRRWQKEIEAVEQEARVMRSNYQTEQIFLSDDMRAVREHEISDKEAEVLTLKHKYFGEQGELYKRRDALIKPIQEEIYNAISEIANEKKFDVVRDRSSDPALIYMSAKLDISDLVLQKLGAK